MEINTDSSLEKQINKVESDHKSAEKSSKKEFILETLKIIILSAAIIIPFRVLIAAPFIVDGDSMLPNYHNGEYLVVDEISKRFESFKRGEVVVFRPPVNEKKYYIKRIIGLPGETVELKDGFIHIYSQTNPEGYVLNEAEYLANSDIANSVDSRTVLGVDEYFLLGDNRYNSSDSRIFGPVKKSAIRGKTFLRAFPFNEATIFKAPTYLAK